MEKRNVEKLLKRNYINISKYVLYRRKEKKLTQKDLSKLTGIKQSKISEIERGQSGNITLKTLARLAIALDLYIAPFELPAGVDWTSSEKEKYAEREAKTY